MVNTLCLFIDRMEELEREEGRLASTVGILGLLVITIAGLSLMALGTWMCLYSITELINRIFF